MAAPGAPPAPAPAPAPADRPPPRRLVSVGDVVYCLYPVVPVSWLLALARVRGALGAILRTRAWRIARANMREVLAVTAGGRGRDPDRLARRFLVNQQLQNLLVMLAPRMSSDALERQMPVLGLEHLDRALEQGRGAVLLASHLNSTSLFVAVVLLRRRGYNVTVALPTPADPWGQTRLRNLVDRWAGVAPLKEQMGGFYAQFNVRPLMARLGRNEAVVMTGDGWHAASFVEVEFLGRQLPFPTGALSVARAARAPVVPVFGLGEPVSGVRFTLESSFAVPHTERADRDVRDAVAAYARRLEACLLEYPAGWQHWAEPDLLETLVSLPGRSLEDRYRL